MLTEQFCGPNREWVQFFSGEGAIKEGEGTCKAVDREAFRKIIETRLSLIANRDDNEVSTEEK